MPVTPPNASISADHIAGAEGLFEPQRQSNWILVVHGLPGNDDENIRLSLRSGNAPQESNDEIEIPYINSRRYVAGMYLPESLPLVLNDFVDVGTAHAIARWRQLVYDSFTDRVGLASSYKRRCSLILFDPLGFEQREWIYVGVWPQAVNYGALDMGTSDVVQIEVTLRYDKVRPGRGMIARPPAPNVSVFGGGF